MNIRTDIAQHLHNQAIGVLDSTLFDSMLPDIGTGTFSMAVIDTGGMLPDIDLPTDRPTFQILIRSTTYAIGKAKLDAVFSALHKQMNKTLVPNGTYFYWIRANSRGGHLGRNDNDQDEFSINFNTLIRRP
jgi:hypothetical protein